VQAGAPSVARGQGAVQTGEAAAAAAVPTAVPVKAQELPYEGMEFKTPYFTIRPAELKTEALSFLIMGSFVAFSLLGKRKNKAQAIAWWKANIDPLGEQFASFAARPESASLVRADGGTYLGHASGRRGTNGLRIEIATLPYHDLLASLYYIGSKIYDLTYTGGYNTVSLTFTLPAIKEASGTSTTGKGKPADDYVWALVRKNFVQELRSNDKTGFDLQAFTTVSEPSAANAAAYYGNNDEFLTMTEAGVLNDYFLKGEKVGFRELFDPKNEAGKRALTWLQSVIVSDVVNERPEEATLEKEGSIPKARRLAVVMTLPPSRQAGETLPIVELALNLLDVLNGSSPAADLASKAKRRRAEVHSLLLQESRQEAKDKALSAQLAIKKKAEADMLDKMTPAEKRKYQQKQQEKMMKKQAVQQQKR